MSHYRQLLRGLGVTECSLPVVCSGESSTSLPLLKVHSRDSEPSAPVNRTMKLVFGRVFVVFYKPKCGLTVLHSFDQRVYGKALHKLLQFLLL
jgi:hypothetical protein